MRWTQVGDSLCPVARTAAVIGDRWTLLILREAFQGHRRFDALQTQLGISPHLLSVRLKRLVQEDLLRKEPGGDYRLTRAGIALQPVLLSIAQWGNTWRADAEGPHSQFVHDRCGHAFDPSLHCSACNSPAAPDSVRTIFSDALAAERAARR